MKKLMNKVFLLPIIVLGMIVVFSTCKKDETCEAVIKVKFDGADSVNAMPEALVILNKVVNVNGRRGGMQDSGFTSTTAEYIYKKDLEAILDVDVYLDTNYRITHNMKDIHYYGTDVLRLRAGKTVRLTVYISPVDSTTVFKNKTN